MPYELSFVAKVTPADADEYINDCCWGGDVIRDWLLPVVTGRYQSVTTDQEDWGWFIWFREGEIRLAVDIHCDEIDGGRFRILLTACRKRLFGSDVVDAPELERLWDLVVAEVTRRVGAEGRVSTVGVPRSP